MDVSATLNGVGASIDLGYGAGNAEEGITIAMAGDKNTMTVGADGSVMHSLHADKSGQVTVRVLKTSPVNSKLAKLYALQSLSSSAWGQNIITLTNKGGKDFIACRGCAFKKMPDMSYQKDGGINEWVFDAGKIDTIVGTY